MKLLNTVKKILLVKELRNKFLYTLVFAVVYRLGTFIFLPGVDFEAYLGQDGGKIEKSLWDKLLGTSSDTMSLFSLGIGPYISASILIQIATFAIPYFQRLQQEGIAGRSRLNQITRQVTILIAIGRALFHITALQNNRHFLINLDIWGRYWFYVMAILLMTTSSIFCIWLGDCITDKGIGNGASVLIMIGILSSFPKALVVELQAGKHILFVFFETIIFLGVVLLILAFTQATRNIPLQYARQMSIFSRSSYSGVRQYLPLKMNITGVMPMIFANVFITILHFLVGLVKGKAKIATSIHETLSDNHCWQFNALQAAIIFIGTFMYAAVFMNPTKISNELKRNNGFISGIKPGKPTADYIDQTISYIIFPSALFLSFIAILPSLAFNWLGVTKEFSVFYGGTSMLIIVGVIIEMLQQTQGLLHMTYYDDMMAASQKIPEL